jgi:hypothetical protein
MREKPMRADVFIPIARTRVEARVVVGAVEALAGSTARSLCARSRIAAIDVRVCGRQRARVRSSASIEFETIRRFCVGIAAGARAARIRVSN